MTTVLLRTTTLLASESVVVVGNGMGRTVLRRGEYVAENNAKKAAVIGGSLLGLKAAKAAKDMGLEPHIIDILMCRQIDHGGHNVSVGKIEEMGLKVHSGARTESIVGLDGFTDIESTSPVAALQFSNKDWEDLDIQMVIISAGSKPRDDLGKVNGS